MFLLALNLFEMEVEGILLMHISLIWYFNAEKEFIVLLLKKLLTYRRFNAIVSQLKMHYFSGGAFESLISSQLLKK